MAVVLSVTNFVAVFDGIVVTVALPSIQADLGLRQLDAQWLITAYAVALGGMLLFGGRCGDRYGRRRILVIGLSLFVGGLLVAGGAWAPWLLFTARALQGLGAAFAIPNSFAIISALRPPDFRRRIFASVAVAGGLGAAGGAIIGGLMTEGLGWRFVFLLTALVAGAAAVLATKVLDGSACNSGPGRPDLVAAFLSLAGLGLLVLAITDIARAGLLAPATMTAFILSVLFLVAFVVRERHSKAPLVPSRILRDRALWAAVSGLPGVVFAYDGTAFIGPLFLQQVAGFRPLETGLAFGPLGVAVLAGSPIAGFVLRRLHWSLVAAGAQLLCTAGLIFLQRAPGHAGYLTHVLPGLMLIGTGAAISVIAFNSVAGSNARPTDHGGVYAVYETVKYLTGALAVATLSTVAAGMGSLADGYGLAFTVSAVIAFTCGVAALIVGRLTRKDIRA
ncbi:MFS transporter [Amycolatopsis pithecellobii]|uniref:MFS transporter n=1 Tax=Amycolatopsis pithecellobii TaxID=664692 RepID=UPI00140A4E88|nr:MFS transporter [Amycolatopsis pithecellobii]